jgi:hypothetical protein
MFRRDPPWFILVSMEAMITHLHSHVAVSDQANHRQADYFRDELHRQIGLINERVVKCQAKLATDTRHRRIEQVRLVQGELRNCAIERRKLMEMIATLTRRFPDEEVALAR